MKDKVEFSCQECGYVSYKWMGKCPVCQNWNTFVEEKVLDKKDLETQKRSISINKKNKSVSLKSLEVVETIREKLGIDEIDRVLGGGLVSGSLILLSGDPGIGKSTLLMQIAGILSAGKSVLYVSGEESINQVKMRCDRLGVTQEKLFFLGENIVNRIEDVVEEEKPDFLIIDSIQTMFNQELTGTPGSVGQVREATMAFMKISKSRNITTFVVGHVTKSGSIAGPKVLEHMVDVVLYLEGEKDNLFRVLRCEKNRFGSTEEIGVFEMGERGLEEVNNPSLYFMNKEAVSEPGLVLIPVIEGSRVLFVEVQTLVVESFYPNPRRIATGYEINRLHILSAIVEKKLKVYLSKNDIYLNTIGGIKVNDRGADLGIIISLISSNFNIKINRKTLFIGEVGLGGEVRRVPLIEKRVREASKFSFERIIVPVGSKIKSEKEGIEVIECMDIFQVVRMFFKNI